MSSKTEIKTKTVRIYELDHFEKLLKGIRVAACMITESHQVVDEASVLKRLRALTLNGASDGNCCSCCGVGPFDSRAQQTAHYKNHWHTHNLKRKLFGKAPLSLGQFNSKQDDSSVSGSDSDTEEITKNPASDLFAAATRHCKAFFTNQKGQVFCIYRCILHHKKEVLSSDGEGIAWVDRCERLAIPGFQRWAIFMVSGGHFAGAIFAGSVVVLHKTMHSYVTRRGQGQSQANRDQHGNAPRSAGASLRRYNQAQFLEHVQDIISSWTQDLVGCSLILYRAVGSMNQGALFGKNSPLNRDDMRVRALPFPTRKPTYKEVQRVHETVASLEVYDTMELFQKALIASTTKSATKVSSETSVDRNKKTQKSPHKPIDRAKSRERTPRELPTQMISSEDEGPCFIDSETPADWIKTLSEQSSNGVITSSRKDLLNDHVLNSDASASDCEVPETKTSLKKKKKKKEEKNVIKKVVVKIPDNVKEIWKVINSKDGGKLGTILEELDPQQLAGLCNTPDPRDGNTALHKAALADSPDMVTRLLSAGGDPCVRNLSLQTPYAAAPGNTRLAFRMFQAQFPDKYNYNKSQIPGPVTPEQLEQEKERKAQQKRAKRQREKEKQTEKNKTNKFLAMNDTQKSQIPGPVTPEQLEQEKERKAQQKRAKRQREKEKQTEKNKTNKFLAMNDTQKLKAVEFRCFLCGTLLPREPFEYDTYQFCSIKCLQNHRNLRPLHKSA